MAQQGGLSPEAAEFDPRRTDDDSPGGLSPEAAEFEPRRTHDDSPGGLSPEVAELDSQRTDDDSPPGFFSRHLPRQPRQPRYWPKHFFSDSRNRANPPVQAPLQGNGNGGITPGGAFDPFVTTPTPMTPGAVGPVSANPYSHDPTGAMGGAFFASQTGFQQPVRFGDQRILLLFASYKF